LDLLLTRFIVAGTSLSKVVGCEVTAGNARLRFSAS
jgi:hypothetical protein